jgi:hypothetical protein
MIKFSSVVIDSGRAFSVRIVEGFTNLHSSESVHEHEDGKLTSVSSTTEDVLVEKVVSSEEHSKRLNVTQFWVRVSDIQSLVGWWCDFHNFYNL